MASIATPDREGKVLFIGAAPRAAARGILHQASSVYTAGGALQPQHLPGTRVTATGRKNIQDGSSPSLRRTNKQGLSHWARQKRSVSVLPTSRVEIAAIVERTNNATFTLI
jgi:hypothetical protein